MALHLFHDLQGFRFRRSRAELDFHGQDALILVGQKRRGIRHKIQPAHTSMAKYMTIILPPTLMILPTAPL